MPYKTCKRCNGSGVEPGTLIEPCSECDGYGDDPSTGKLICSGCGGEINPDYGKCQRCA